MDLSAPWPRLELRAPPALPARSSAEVLLKFFTTSALNCFEWPFAETRFLLPGATRGGSLRQRGPVTGFSSHLEAAPRPSRRPHRPSRQRGKGRAPLVAFGFGTRRQPGVSQRGQPPPRPMAGLPGGGMPPMGGAYPPGQQGLEGPNPLSQAMVAAQAVQNLGAQIDREKKRMENEVTEVRRPAPAPLFGPVLPRPAVVEPAARSRSRVGAGTRRPFASQYRAVVPLHLDSSLPHLPAPGRSPSLPPPRDAPED